MKNNINLHILKTSQNLRSLEGRIKKSFKKGVKKIVKVLPVKNVDVVVYDSPNQTIKKLGISGTSANYHTVFIPINPKFKDLNVPIKQELPRTLAHELHHCLRWRDPGYGKTLLEEIVTEGLADNFDLEVFGGSPRPWNTALNEEEKKKMLKKAKKIWNNKNFNHNDWFYGTEDKNIPRWTGYTLGYELVKNYIEKTNQKPSKIYNIPANKIKEEVL